MTSKVLVSLFLLALLISPNVAWSAKWSRGQCINAVHERLGVSSTNARGAANRAAVIRCMQYGPMAIG